MLNRINRAAFKHPDIIKILIVKSLNPGYNILDNAGEKVLNILNKHKLISSVDEQVYPFVKAVLFKIYQGKI